MPTKRIVFPYCIQRSPIGTGTQKTAVFFGADFYNLPLDSNQDLFRERTDQILEYMRVHLPKHRLVYQPHPNETTEYTLLNLTGFTVGEHTVAEIYLYENAREIDYVFSAQSGASISAFAMGFDSVIFLDLLHGALSEESITGYRSYFAGLPEHCFMKSFDQELVRRIPLSQDIEKTALAEIARTIVNPTQTLWLLAGDPSLGIRAAILVTQLRTLLPQLRARLLVVNHRRWQLGLSNNTIRAAFDEVLVLPGQRVWYGLSLKRVWAAVQSARYLKRLPIEPGDTLFSFNNALFEENCLLSYHPSAQKVLFIENKWHQFIYGDGYRDLPASKFKTSWGVRFFHYVLEPLLGLWRTQYSEYDDGKVLNLFRYSVPLERNYDTVFLCMPAPF